MHAYIYIYKFKFAPFKSFQRSTLLSEFEYVLATVNSMGDNSLLVCSIKIDMIMGDIGLKKIMY